MYSWNAQADCLVEKNQIKMAVFHYAFKVKDLASTRAFYIDILGCQEGRSTESWVDFNLFGNQMSAHVSKNIPALDYCGKVDGISVPIPHFGCVLNNPEFILVKKRLEEANVEFLIKPQTRYEGQPGEQMTMFVLDLSGNAIEFKSLLDEDAIFSKKK